jgi:hypothetical protein
MIEIGRSQDFAGITVCLRGPQLTSEFMRIPVLLMEHCRQEQCWKVMFYLSEVESWRFSIDASMSPQLWVDIGRLIERAAIIYNYRWNRQAAWLGAALRLGGSQVRSYRPMEFDKALNWLG